jgi:hypothetical protein
MDHSPNFPDDRMKYWVDRFCLFLSKARINWIHKLEPDMRRYFALPWAVVIYLSLLAEEYFKANCTATPCLAESANIF